MRNTVIRVVLFSCALITLSANGVQALSSQDLALTEDPLSVRARTQELQEQKDAVEKVEAKKAQEAKKALEAKKIAEAQPRIHRVISGDSLTKIAERHGITWRRLFDKNVNINDPDTLLVGETLTIPEAHEELAERPLPEAAPLVASPSSNSINQTTQPRSQVIRGGVAGNTYSPGYCTWYAKNRRPDLPNRLGNAASWVSSAAAQGFATGSVPRVGAIGQQGNHVVYVESVNADGTITVSEMNYRGLYVVSSRTVASNTFRYIY